MEAMKLAGIVTTIAAVAVTMLAGTSAAQTPQPFPRPDAPAPERPAPQPPPAAPRQPAAPAAAPAEPTEATLGFPIYPTAQFIASYDAGRGQRYYLFGTTATFEEMVTYYRNLLRERGNVVFDQPPTHMFEIGRFRDDSMAFPPGVTIKDYSWGGGKGYPNPRRGVQPERFPTLIMIVPAPGA